MKFSTIEIKKMGHGEELTAFIDGKEIEQCTNVIIESPVGQPVKITVEFLATVLPEPTVEKMVFEVKQILE